MSEDRRAIIKARNALSALLMDYNPDTSRMAIVAVEELARACEDAIDRGLRAEATIHELIKDAQEARR